MSDNGHGYDWSDLRDRPAGDLAVGDTFVSGLGAFTAYMTGRDGRVRSLMGCEPPGGTAWTVTAREGNVTTALGHDGRVETQEIPERARVLMVEPKGTVLAVNSHRASERLERALGRQPAAYYDKAMRRGGKFVVLYGDDVTTALGITSITRTRLAVDDVALCMSSRTTVGDNGLRVVSDDSEYTRRDADREASLLNVPRETSRGIMKLVYSDGSDVQPDDQLTNGFMGTYVTIVRIASGPWEEENAYDDGQVLVRESWGAETTVPVGKLRPSVRIKLEEGDEGY